MDDFTRAVVAAPPIPSMRDRMLETTLFNQDNPRFEVYRVGLTNKELDEYDTWDKLRMALMHKGVPLYKLAEGANFRQINVRDGVILEFE